jgi:hypothetical protein
MHHPLIREKKKKELLVFAAFLVKVWHESPVAHIAAKELKN